jgi:sugar phosphate permease
MPPRLNPRYERWRWQIFGVTWLAYAGYYLTRRAFSVAKNELKRPEVLGLTKAQMSWMDGTFSAAYALGQFFWGTLGDKFGPRRVVLVGMLASAVTAALTGLSSTAWSMGALFALQGVWQASGWPPLAKNMGEFFSQRERGSVMGLGMFVMGFLVLIPDSLISGAAAIDFGTKKGASTASGVINGCGSLGQMIGVILPGSVESLLGKGQDIWPIVFIGLGVSLALAGLLLATQWNRVPLTKLS